jgi:hypothetical protein
MLRDRRLQQGLEIPGGLQSQESNLLTHMHFLHLSRGLGNFRTFEEFQEAFCQVEKKGLFNKLQALASGNKYALHDIYGWGFQIYLAGSVAYITLCLLPASTTQQTAPSRSQWRSDWKSTGM